jgi:hypothetical protein
MWQTWNLLDLARKESTNGLNLYTQMHHPVYVSLVVFSGSLLGCLLVVFFIVRPPNRADLIINKRSLHRKVLGIARIFGYNRYRWNSEQL